MWLVSSVGSATPFREGGEDVTEGIDLVVVNYHTPNDLYRFVESLKEASIERPWTLTVVDVESNHDLDPEILGQLHDGEGLDHFMGARLLEVDDNCGYARACNLAASQIPTPCPVIAFFNADVRTLPGAIESCMDLIWSGMADITGPRQVDSRGRVTHAGIFGTPERPQHRDFMGRDSQNYTDVRDAYSVSGSAYFCRRALWDEMTPEPGYVEFCVKEFGEPALGAFLPTPHYYEETWLSRLAVHFGYRVVYNGEALMIHEWHQASPKGGWADQQMPISRNIFRKACDHFGITHD